MSSSRRFRLLHPARNTHRQIATLVTDFARFSDGRKWSSLARLLTYSIRLSALIPPKEVVVSARQFVRRWGTYLHGLGITHHSFSVRYMAVYDAEATCFVDAVVTVVPDRQNVLQWGGQLSFVFVRQAGTWRISRLDIIPLWITDSPEAAPLLERLKKLLTFNATDVIGASKEK